MCEASVYILKDGQEELILHSAERVESHGDRVRLVNLFGDEKTVRGRVKTFSLVDHKIILEPR